MPETLDSQQVHKSRAYSCLVHADFFTGSQDGQDGVWGRPKARSSPLLNKKEKLDFCNVVGYPWSHPVNPIILKKNQHEPDEGGFTMDGGISIKK